MATTHKFPHQCKPCQPKLFYTLVYITHIFHKHKIVDIVESVGRCCFSLIVVDTYSLIFKTFSLCYCGQIFEKLDWFSWQIFKASDFLLFKMKVIRISYYENIMNIVKKVNPWLKFRTLQKCSTKWFGAFWMCCCGVRTNHA